jgi:hypothetical protein
MREMLAMISNRLGRRSRVASVIVGAGLVAAIAVGQVSGANTADRDPQRSTKVDKATALAIASEAAQMASPNRAGAKVEAGASTSVSDVLEGAMSRYYEINGAGFSARVDAHYGTVLTMLVPDNLPTGVGGKAVSPAAALQIATAYLDANSIPTDGLTPQVVSKNRGPGLETYQVTWSRRVHGVLMPEERFVEIDALTGAVFRLHDLRRSAADPAEPTVSQKNAVSAAQLKIGAPGSKLESADLAIRVDADGTEHVVWTIELSQNTGELWDHAYLVEVDAYSGAATVIATT